MSFEMFVLFEVFFYYYYYYFSFSSKSAFVIKSTISRSLATFAWFSVTSNILNENLVKSLLVLYTE